MGIVEWFLGVHFSWQISLSLVLIHMNQLGFTSNLVKSFVCKARDGNPLATPYQSGIPVNSIAPLMDANDSFAQIHKTQAYQSLIGSIGRLAMTTRPDLTATAIHSFLFLYNAKPLVGYMKSALYVLHYIRSTCEYGISFTSKDMVSMHSYIHFPSSTDVKVYTNPIPPKLLTTHTLLAYSDACWGLQIGNAVAKGTLPPLFKFWSMNGGIIFKNGGPIRWLGECQERMSLSSFEAKIWATNAMLKRVVDLRNLSCSVSENGHTLDGLSSPMVLYNNNDACVKWLHDMTSKTAHHIKLCEDSIWEWVLDKTLNVVHVTGKINLVNNFTKEMKDGAHFRRLRDSFMICLSDFVNDSLLDLHHACQLSPQLTLAGALVSLASGYTSYIAALASSSLCHTLSNVSHLCSAGQHLFWKYHSLVPSGLL
jgi:hypothetical protein